MSVLTLLAALPGSNNNYLHNTNISYIYITVQSVATANSVAPT